MELNSHFKGKITELLVAQAFLELGYQVSQPLVSDSRYDLIIDIDGTLLRIQVKTSTVDPEDESYFEFVTRSSHTNTQRTINRPYTSDEIDCFATIYNGECYIVPVKEAGNGRQRLRLKPTKNNQKTGIKFAEDYKLEKILLTD